MSKELRWYQLPQKKLFETLSTSPDGLTSEASAARLKQYGYNELVSKRKGPVQRFMLQFKNPLLYVLIVAALVCFVLYSFMDADTLMDMWVIIGVVLATVIIGFIQEGKAESSLEALKKMMVPQCTVLRNGVTAIIPTRELVPGDVVLLEDGDRVPADLRLFLVKNLAIDEATLTGESLPVQKNIETLSNPNLGPGDQINMCFSGTFVTRGRGQGVVVATGEQTILGRIAHVMKETKKIAPPIMRKVASFTKVIIIVCIAFGVINFILGTLLGYELGYMLLATVGVIVAMIPEGLAGAIIAAFAVGAIAMSRRNALIKRLPAAETLGCTTVICSDKTGTLTKNEMTVTRVFAGGVDYRVSGVGYEPRGKFFTGEKEAEAFNDDHKCLIETLKAGLCCNNCVLVETEQCHGIKGDPTEGALVVSAAKAGISPNLARLDEIPFNSDLRYMATINRNGDGNVIYVKGSPEKILAMCHNQATDEGLKPLRREEISAKVSEMAREALRVIGIAYKNIDTEKNTVGENDLQGLTFLGLQGMIDPPRDEAIKAVKQCKDAGIRVVMITGDHVETAKAVAGKLGIGGDDHRALTGQELEVMSDEELHEAVRTVSIFARVAPEHKYRVVDQLQKHRHIVAVTGDGVNDAPALKRADIGIAMGITGTEVSKEAADMVLADDNFASIVAAVEEGRHVFTNIWKVILYLLPTNFGQGIVMIGAVLLSPFVPTFATRLPIEPVQILWVNLIIAIGCSIPLIWEPKEKGILTRPPRDPDEKLFNPIFFRKVVLVSIVSAIAVFALFLIYTGTMGTSADRLVEAQTVAFTTLIMIQIAYLFTARSVDESAFTFSPFSNKYVLIGVGATVGLQLLIVYSAPLFGISPFRTAPFPVQWWLPIVLVSMAGFFIIELEKFVRKRLIRAKK